MPGLLHRYRRSLKRAQAREIEQYDHYIDDQEPAAPELDPTPWLDEPADDQTHPAECTLRYLDELELEDIR